MGIRGVFSALGLSDWTQHAPYPRRRHCSLERVRVGGVSCPSVRGAGWWEDCESSAASTAQTLRHPVGVRVACHASPPSVPCAPGLCCEGSGAVSQCLHCGVLGRLSGILACRRPQDQCYPSVLRGGPSGNDGIFINKESLKCSLVFYNLLCLVYFFIVLKYM